MKRIKLALAFFTILSSLAFAGFNDVPINHWASNAVKNLYNKGLLAPTLDNSAKFNGEGVFSRYEIASMLYSNLNYINEKLETKASATDLEALKTLMANFAPELVKLGLKSDELDKKITKMEKNIEKKLGRKVDRMSEIMNSVKVSGDFDISQNWNNTVSQKGLESMDYKGNLYINGKPTKNVMVRTKFKMDKGTALGTDALELTANSKYGRLDIFKDNNKMPASLNDSFGLFCADSVKPTEGVIFKGRVKKVLNEEHTGMFYKTDSGDFYGLRSAYKLNLSKLYLGNLKFGGTYVEKILNYFYLTDAEGNKIKNTENKYDQNMGTDFTYDNSKLFKLHLEGEIVKSEGMQTRDDSFANSTSYYGVSSLNFFNFIKGEAGYYNSGKDFYYVATNSSASVFPRFFSDDATVKLESDRKAYYGYSEVKLGKFVKVTGMYVNSTTQNKYDKPLEYIQGIVDLKPVNAIEFNLEGESYIEEWKKSDHKDVTADDYAPKKAKLTITPTITLKPMLGIKIAAYDKIVKDPNTKVGKNKDKDSLTNEANVTIGISKGIIRYEGDTDFELGVISDNDADKTFKNTTNTKLSIDLTKTIGMSIFDQFIAVNNQADKNMSGDGVENTIVSSISKSLESGKISLIGGYKVQNKYANDGDKYGKLSSGIVLGAAYEHNYNSDTKLTILGISGGTITNEDNDDVKYSGTMSYGDKYIDLGDISVEEGTAIKLLLSTKF